MTAIRPSMPAVRIAPARAVSAAAPAPAAKPAAKPAAPVQPKAQTWDVKHVLKTAGVGAAGFAGGGVATVVADLFFHFGNNGGTAWPGGIYLAAAGLVAAGGMALYHHFSQK